MGKGDYCTSIKVLSTLIFLINILVLNSLAKAAVLQVSQQHRIVGKVSASESGKPLIGVNILDKGTTKGTITDSNGNYVLNVKSLQDTLIFSYIGYKTQKIPIAGRTEINVTMQEKTESLQQLTVVGYGKQKKISLVGAQSTVEPSKLETSPVGHVSSMLAGKLAGIVSVQRTGEPGGNNKAQIWIRGISTFQRGLSHPLVLVDGVPGGYNYLNVEDIKSFTILKDAAATAIYGVRGANGVILIKTKKGRPGKPRVHFKYNEGVTAFTRLPNFADGVTFMKAANDALTERGQTPRFSEEVIEKTRKQTDPYLYPDVDWYQTIFKNRGHIRQAHLDVNGGSDNTIYYVSASYLNNVGQFRTSKLVHQYNNQISDQRFNTAANLTMHITNTTQLFLGIKGYLDNGHFPGYERDRIYNDAYYASPIAFPPEFPNGKVPNFIPGNYLHNPFADLTRTGYRTYYRSNIRSNIKLRQDLSFWVPGLSIKTKFGFQTYNTTSKRRTKTPDSYTAVGRDSTTGELKLQQIYTGQQFLGYNRVSGGNRFIYARTQLNYKHDFGPHTVGALFEYNQSNKSYTQAGSFISSLPHRFRGIGGRVTYDYNDTYFLAFNWGYNGSENFAPGHRFGFFPSGGGAWVISNEPFFKHLNDIFRLFKVRFSYGQVGSSNIAGRRFAYLATVNTNAGGYRYGRDLNNFIGGVAVGEYASDVTWETATKANIGLNLWMLDGDLKLTFDVFKNHRTGIFLRRDDLPGFPGITARPFGNLGVINNKGYDGTLKYGGQIGSVFLNVKGTITFNRNTVIKNAKPYYEFPWMEAKGHKVDQRLGYIALGLFKSEEEIANSPQQTGDVRPGDIKFKDIDGNGKIGPNDRTWIGYGVIPEMTYGLSFTVSYKRFSLYTLFQGTGNVDIYLNGSGLQPFVHGINHGNLFAKIKDRWTKKNPDLHAFYPRLAVPTTINQNYHSSTWWLKNGRYLRIKNAILAYNFPSRWLQKAHIKSARIFIAGRNLLTFSPFKMWDPEMGNGRGAAYPLTKGYSAGLEFHF